MTVLEAMPKYEEYMDSGVKWLGNIPSHWDLTRLATRFEERKTKVSDNDFAPLSVTKNGVVPQLSNAAKSNDGDNRKLVKKGDFVINSRSDRKGSSGVANSDGSVSLINIVLEPKSISPSFCEYLLKSYNFIEEFYRMGHGIVADLWTTRYDEMKAVIIGIPPLQEQTAIANFLDKKTTQIDEAIAIKQKQIELLKERKQIIIQKAVTQGLDPNVPLRDSGVDWIGEIPEHWIVVKLKLLSNKIVDGAHFTPTYVDKGIPFLRVTDLTKMKEGKINWDETRCIPEKEHRELIKRAKADVGDVLLSKNGTIGLTKVIDWNVDFSFFVSLCLIKLKPLISPFYFTAFFNSPIVDQQITFGSSRTSVTNLHLDKIKELLIVLPPEQEQDDIVNHIAYFSRDYDLAIDLQKQQIEKLQEYKTTLINSAVTGKIKIPLAAEQGIK